MSSILVANLAIFSVWLIYYVIFKFSINRYIPSLKTLSIRAIVLILLGLFSFIFTYFWFFYYNSTNHQFSFYGYTPPPFVFEVGVFPHLLLSWIGVVFWLEKQNWVRQNPKYGRLILQESNNFSHIEGVAIRSIDGVVNGRGISFSWVNGYLIAKGKHKIELEFYKYAKFRKNFSYNSIYSKVVTIDVVPGVNYAIEAQPDKQSFYISRTLDKRR